MSNRREFLTQSVAAGGVLALGSAHLLGAAAASANAAKASKSLRILILGGTGYIGPHYVRAALDRGHKVAVFNRGKGGVELPAQVEQLIGDRNGSSPLRIAIGTRSSTWRYSCPSGCAPSARRLKVMLDITHSFPLAMCTVVRKKSARTKARASWNIGARAIPLRSRPRRV